MYRLGTRSQRATQSFYDIAEAHIIGCKPAKNMMRIAETEARVNQYPMGSHMRISVFINCIHQ